MAKAVGYIRVSTDDQHLGMDAQRSSIAAWCEANGHELSAVHVDHGVSGGAPVDKRPGMLAAINELSDGAVLVAAKRDRIARSVIVAATVERLASKRGATVATADGVTSDDTPEGNLNRTIIYAFAEYEKAVIAARTAAALAEKRADGYRVGNCPFGYTADEDGRLVEDATEQEIIAIVLELRRRGVTLARVAEALNRKRFSTRTGARWTVSKVSHLARTAAAAATA